MKKDDYQATMPQLTPEQAEQAKKAAIACYEAGDPDAALELLHGVPRDAEVRQLLFYMRCDDQAKGIVVHNKLKMKSEE